MEITQTYLANYLGKQTLVALEDKVILHYKNLYKEFTVEFEYSEFRAKTTKGREGDSSWTSLGWNLFIWAAIGYLGLRLVFPPIRENIIFSWFFSILLIFSFVSHLMRFVKDDTIAFFDKENHYIFEIKVSGKNKTAALEMVEFITNRISRHETISNSEENMKTAKKKSARNKN